MPKERVGELRIVPIEYPIVQLQYHLVDANGQVLPGDFISDPAEKWSELKRRLLVDVEELTAAEAIIRRGDIHLMGIRRFEKA